MQYIIPNITLESDAGTKSSGVPFIKYLTILLGNLETKL